MTQCVGALTVRVMFERVLVGVDGRPGGRDAIALARRLAGPGAALVLANVYDEAAGRGPGTGPATAKRLLAGERLAAGLQAKTVVARERRPGRGLGRLAADEAADLLVVGSCHRSAIGRVLLGDDAVTALNGAPCAVAIAPRGYEIAGHQMRTIGVGHDGSLESEAGLHAAREIALADGAEISVLAVVSLQSVPSITTVPLDWTSETERMMTSERIRVAGNRGWRQRRLRRPGRGAGQVRGGHGSADRRLASGGIRWTDAGREHLEPSCATSGVSAVGDAARAGPRKWNGPAGRGSRKASRTARAPRCIPGMTQPWA